MGASAVFSALLTLVAGIGIFLIACEMMSHNLESASSTRLKSLFAKASGSKLLGVGIGAVGTAAIQSSGAVTVMVIGFVNASIISLQQAATIIYGANIGTTVTAQIVALGMFGGGGVSTSIIFSAFAGVGAFIAMFAKREMLKKIGGILTGFGMLFVGLEMMSGSMKDFAAMDAVKDFLAMIGNPFLLVLIGAVFTAIIQSSSVMTSIALAMVVSGLINLNQGIFLTMGSNIGSCVVALIAGITSGMNAKRTSLIHLFFNVSGVVVFLAIGLLISLFTGGDVTFGTLFEKMFPDAPQTQLAMFHTIFNVCTVILMLPLTNLLVSLVCRIIPETKTVDPDAPHLYFIDTNMLKTPPVAVQQTKAEILNMAGIAIKNFNRSLDIICKLDFSKAEEFRKHEVELDFLNTALIDFIVKLSAEPALSEKDHLYLATTYRTVRDLERIGDYAENIVEYAASLKDVQMNFSPLALREIASLKATINELYSAVIQAYKYEDLEALETAEALEQQVDVITKHMEDNHISRLAEGVCTPEVGAHYLSLSTNTERVGDHLMNVGKSIRRLVVNKPKPRRYSPATK